MKILPKRILRYAVAASLAIHIIVAHFVRPPSVSAASEPPPEHSVIIHIKPPVKKVVPTPTPRPQPQHHFARSSPAHPPRLTYHTNLKGASSEHRIAIATAAPGSGINPNGPDFPASPEPTEAPGTPVPTVQPTPQCTAPDVPAHALNAITPETPELARQEGLSGVTEVRVDLAADGSVESVSVFRSSGSTLLDAAAVRAAKASSYAANQRDCKSISGSYIFRAEFDN